MHSMASSLGSIGLGGFGFKVPRCLGCSVPSLTESSCYIVAGRKIRCHCSGRNDKYTQFVDLQILIASRKMGGGLGNVG